MPTSTPRKIQVRILELHRLPNSSSGNPVYRVSTSGIQQRLRTSPDSSVNYDLPNPEFHLPGMPESAQPLVELTLDADGRITHAHQTCESCHTGVHRDGNGWWVGEDRTSDCPASAQGHTVNGGTR